MITINKQIACVPIVRDFKPDLKVSSGFGTVKQRTELVELKVSLDSDLGYKKGDSIFVNGVRLDTSTWGKTNLSLEGVDLILVPETEVLIVKKGEEV